jgi:RND family efflux transporter MFP subunit
MKKITTVMILAVTLAACGGSSTLETKRKELDQKKEEMRKLRLEIEALEVEIAKLDTSAKEHFIPVSTETIAKGTFKHPVKLQGMVESDKDVTVSAELGGKVIRIYVKEGQKVRKGQMVASLDGATVAGQVGELEAALKMARTNYEKQERLWNQNIGSEIQYLQAKNQVERLESSLQSARAQLGKFNLTSPINGTVDQIFANEGQILAPGMSMVARIVNTDEIKIRADVSERYLGKLDLGEEVVVYYPTLDTQYSEKIGAVGNHINPDNRTFGLTIFPQNKSTKMKPNLLAIITAYDFIMDSVITVPTKLIRNDGNGDYILTITKDKAGINRVSKTSVKVLRSFAGETILESGLNQGDRIIVQGYDNVIGGDAVEIVEQ